MATSRMVHPNSLSELAADLIFGIFARCNISSVVSTSQLKRSHILDSVYTPDLRKLSTDHLIALAKRLVNGPDTWSHRNSGFTLEVSKEIVIHPKCASGMPADNEMKLLPSGRHVLLNNADVLGCWDVAEDRLVWEHTPLFHSSTYITSLEFAAEEAEDGVSLLVMICERCVPNGADSGRARPYESSAGYHNLLLTAWCPVTHYDDPFGNPVIRGNIPAVPVASGYFILDWKAQSSLLLGPQMSIALILGHLVLKAPGKTTGEPGPEIHLISNDALHAHFARAINIEDDAEFAAEYESGPRITEVLLDDIAKRSKLRTSEACRLYDMRVHESPLRHNSYRVWLEGERSSSGGGHALWCYHVSVPRVQQPRWRPRAPFPIPSEGPMCAPELAYSGHTLRYSADTDKPCIITPTAAPEEAEDARSIWTSRNRIMTYLATTSIPSVVIRYFK
ncbi:hypothetical protein DFH09DRAFT_1082372 [Mycena vulgaris]|nr:hypothetical protein DFH09DRAFT_1082372 [Mycena vulgaris]